MSWGSFLWVAAFGYGLSWLRVDFVAGFLVEKLFKFNFNITGTIIKTTVGQPFRYFKKYEH
jgi:biotin transporter BioY